MKKLKYLLLVIFLFSVGINYLFCNPDNVKRSDGWYFITLGQKDSIGKKPFLTVKDFKELSLDSIVDKNNNGNVVYLILGSVKPDKQKVWADATEKSIGKYIGFVYNNNLIYMPYVNCKIESGNFMINTDQKQIYNKLIKVMNSK